MVKFDKTLATPRRRVSARNAVSSRKVSKVLAQPLTKVVPCVARVSNMTVVVRVRPPNKKELDHNSRTVVKVIDDQLLIFDPKEEQEPFFYHGVKQRDFLKRGNKELQFMFDKVCGNESTNMEVYAHSTKILVDTLMNGYNCSVFAYGATGAGKTFTMIGTEDSPGITYLTMKYLFQKKDELSSDRKFELMVTYVEIYNEVVKDLLCSNDSPLCLREDSKYGVIISGVKFHKITDPGELFSLLEQGNKRRTQHVTDANAESSRSHAVFQVYIHMTSKNSKETSTAKLSMIDLAGSERGSATGYVGPRFKEGANINRSLLALGNCINSLISGKKHIPYRDSKLTHLLKDSLGGNCYTVMIANVSPSSLSFEETYNTLKYAFRAKSIKSNVKKNIVSGDLRIEQYIELVSNLQKENAKLKADVDSLKVQNEALAEEKTAMKKEIEVLNTTVDTLSMEKAKGDGPSPFRPEHRSGVRMEVLQQFAALVDEQKQTMQIIFELEKSILTLKKQADIETTFKNTTNGKINKKNLTDKYDKEEKDLRVQIEKSDSAKSRTFSKLNNMLVVYPELYQEYEKSMFEIEKLDVQYRGELTQMKSDILMQMLASFRVQKRPKSQPTTVLGSSSNVGVTNTRSKRTVQDKQDMNDTFVMGTNKSSVKAKTRTIAVKGFKTRTSKRFGPGTFQLGKENTKAGPSHDMKKSAKKRWI